MRFGRVRRWIGIPMLAVGVTALGLASPAAATADGRIFNPETVDLANIATKVAFCALQYLPVKDTPKGLIILKKFGIELTKLTDAVEKLTNSKAPDSLKKSLELARNPRITDIEKQFPKKSCETVVKLAGGPEGIARTIKQTTKELIDNIKSLIKSLLEKTPSIFNSLRDAAKDLRQLVKNAEAKSPTSSTSTSSTTSTTSTTIPILGTGDVQVTLTWKGAADLDLHVKDPAGSEIWYREKLSLSGGTLDVDDNAGCSEDTSATQSNVENVYWPTGKAPAGIYSAFVVNYDPCGSTNFAYNLRITVDGKVVSDQSGTVGSTAGNKSDPPVSFRR